MATEIIDNQFRILETLGEGMSGTVYKVSREKEIWALKLLKKTPNVEDMETWMEAFMFEFSLLKDISHPHVVGIGDFGLDKNLDRLYFTEEFIDGIPLDQYLTQTSWISLSSKNLVHSAQDIFCKRLKDCDIEKGILLFTQCLEGLEAIHHAKVLHGDIKPSNIFVITKGEPQVKILDLGISHPRFQLTAGTPAFFAPERILKDPVDERSDLYSLAVTFYECLTGTNPFRKKTLVEILKAHTSLTPASPGSLNPKIPPYLNRILLNLLSKNPNDRFRNVQEVLTDLDFERGMTDQRLFKVPLITEKWVGRNEAWEDVARWSEELKSFSLLVITGETGIGKSHFLREIKYELELQGQTIRNLKKDTFSEIEKALYLYDCEEYNEAKIEELLLRLRPTALGLLITLPLEKLAFGKDLAKQNNIPLRITELKKMKKGDIQDLIKLSTHDENPPQELIEGIYNETKGHPGHTVHLLATLCQENKLIGPHGEWNLTLFREGPIDYSNLTVFPSGLDSLLQIIGPERPSERVSLLIRRVEESLNTQKTMDLNPFFDEAETLIKEIPKGPERLKLRINFMEIKGWASIRQGHFDEAKRTIQSAQALIDEMDNPPKMTGLRLKNFYGYILSQQGNFDEAIQVFESTHQEWNKLSPPEKEKVTNNDLGLALMQKGQYKEATKVFTEILPFYQKLSNTGSQNRCYYNLGESYFYLGDYQESIKYYQKAADETRSSRQWALLLRAYNGLGNTYNLLKKTELSLSNYQKGLDLARYLRDYAAAAAIAQNMGVILSELGQMDKANEHLRLSLKLLKNVSEPTPHTRYLKARATLELGEIERQKKHFDEARALISEASQLVSEETTLKDFVFWVLHAQAVLALDQERFNEFVKIYPDLFHHAKTKEQKSQVEFLKKRSSIDPTKHQEKESKKSPPPSQERTIQEIIVPPNSSSHKTHSIRIHPSQSSTEDYLRALLEINQMLNSEKDLSSLLHLILRYALSLSQAESGLILFVDKTGGLEVAASENIDVDEDLSQISQRVANKVLTLGKAIRTDNAMEDEEYKEYRSVMLLGLKSIFCVPIRSQQKILGVLYLTHRFQTALFDDHTENVIQAFADQAGIALSNARLVQIIEEQNKALQSKLTKAEESIEIFKSLAREEDLQTRYPYADIIAKSASMEKVFHILDKITPTNLSVLIRGESGTGKELIARALHKNSPRNEHRFVAINCGALPPNLIESELFGYKKGAFTGANTDKIGLFEEANRGTIFLDEIAELDISLQAKLLRTIQEREIVRVGDTKSISIDVRILSATLKDLRKEIIDKTFREDLFYRITEMQIELPPLRERYDDIPLLVEHFIKQYAKEHGIKKIPKVDPALMHLFMNYSWPGNIRELSNRIRVACALSNGRVVMVDDLPEGDRARMSVSAPPATPKHDPTPTIDTSGAQINRSAVSTAPSSSEKISPPTKESFFKSLLENKKTWNQIETIIMAKALLYFKFDVIKTAKALDIGQATLYNRIRKENIRARKSEFLNLPFEYNEDIKMDELQKEVFKIAYQLNDEKPYHTARLLGISPGTFYKWIK